MESVVSYVKTFVHKGCKIAAQRKSLLFGKICLTSKIFLVSVLYFFGIGGTIRIGQEILCLQSANNFFFARILIGPETECSEYSNIFMNIPYEQYSYLYSQSKNSQIIVIFIFVVDNLYEYYSYSYLFREKIIRYTPDSPIILKTKNLSFIFIFNLIISMESYRKLLIYYAQSSDW